MFHPTWKYHAVAAAKLIETPEDLAALDQTEWKDSPDEAIEALQLKNDPAEAERRALLAQEETALAAHLAERIAQTIVNGSEPAVVEEPAVLGAGAGVAPVPTITIENLTPQVETEEEELARLERETRPATESTPKL